MSWIIARSNTTTHITPWVISNNYYSISDAGTAVRNYNSLHHAPYNVGKEEPIMTSDIKRQLAANGGDTVNAFKKITIVPTKFPALMTKLIQWYWTAEGDGTGGNTVNNVGAGAGKKKTGSSGTPASHFIKAGPGIWVYDYNRKRTDWYLDSLNCDFKASVNLSTAASDGKVVGSTLWKYTGSTGVQQSGLVTLNAYSLDQNYPNPFNPSTTIKYQVPVNGMVSLKVYNLIGQEVASLVSEIQSAASYEASFDASKLSSGVYFYTLRAGNFVETKKMMLLK